MERKPKKPVRKKLTDEERKERKKAANHMAYELKKMQMRKEAGFYFDYINKGKTPEEAELAARNFTAEREARIKELDKRIKELEEQLRKEHEDCITLAKSVLEDK